MKINIESKIRNPAGLKKLIQVMGTQAVADILGERLAAWVVHNFEDEGTEKKWKSLAASTLQLRKHAGSKPLQDTGALKRFVAEPGGRWLVGNVLHVGWRGAIAKIAGYHHYGSGPYEIKVVKAKVLAAAKRGGGFMVFGKAVNHPGIPTRPLLPSVRLAESISVNFLNAAIQRAADASA